MFWVRLIVGGICARIALGLGSGWNPADAFLGFLLGDILVRLWCIQTDLTTIKTHLEIDKRTDNNPGERSEIEDKLV